MNEGEKQNMNIPCIVSLSPIKLYLTTICVCFLRFHKLYIFSSMLEIELDLHFTYSISIPDLGPFVGSPYLHYLT